MGILKEYKIGDCVKCNRPNAFNPEIYVIINTGINSMGEITYVLDKNVIEVGNGQASVTKVGVAKLYGIPSYENEFHPSYLHQDDECLKMQRKLKLDNIDDYTKRNNK